MKLIGPARYIQKMIGPMNTTAPLKVLLYGPPGVGKTTLAEQLAASLGNKFDIESENGRNMTIDVVREWQHSVHTSSMFGDWKVKIINEADVMPKASQDLMLTLLDELPPKRAIICTSNLNLSDMTERFRTRFIARNVEAPTQEEIANLLCERGLPADQAAFIAVSCAGNVRAACLDADAWLSERKHGEVKAVQQFSMEAMLCGL